MNTHPYLRAYMAGITVPTFVLLIALAAFVTVRFVFYVPLPIERVLVFPMALVPTLFGVWNIFYVWLRPRRHLPIGFHGALLPFLLAPLGALLGRCLGILSFEPSGLLYFQQVTLPYPFLPGGFACALIGYYLVWKYVVDFFNRVLGIA